MRTCEECESREKSNLEDVSTRKLSVQEPSEPLELQGIEVAPISSSHLDRALAATGYKQRVTRNGLYIGWQAVQVSTASQGAKNG